MKNTIIGVLIVAIIGLGIYFFVWRPSRSVNTMTDSATTTTPSDTMATSTDKTQTIIGKSVGGRDIVAYHYGTGDTELLFVGGIHGGYEWNTALVAYETADYLKANPDIIPANLKVTVIPVVNPDGLYKVTGVEGPFTASQVSTSQTVQTEGRFNANKVDLNRNFDCDWQASAKWQKTTVSGGTSTFSEPESQAIKKYVEDNNPKAVVVWYSSAGGVFASNCHGGILPETNTLTKTFATASGYPAYQSFDFYAITGDMVNWLAKKGIPAISVLLTNHTDTEWTKNKAGIDALLKSYTK